MTLNVRLAVVTIDHNVKQLSTNCLAEGYKAGINVFGFIEDCFLSPLLLTVADKPAKS
jgi:hypothetical protein